MDAEGAPHGKPFPPRLHCGPITRRVQRGGGSWAYAPTSGQVFRREFLERIFPVPEALYRTSADAYVAGLAGMIAEVVGVRKVLAHYRVHGANAWLGGKNREETLRHQIHRFEVELHGLNEALQRVGSPKRVRLQDHFIYHILMWQAGRRASIGRLLWLTARDPSEQWVRIRTMAGSLASLLRAKLAARSNPLETTR